ncbi:uncharacterized protein LOC142323014 [Lycorma delicatula]|uniref:uncharacterized protein LOC142323014 n=1 Tax=Lycorma delicatula TaxID=130591 RepID=UPI003F50FC9E
MLRGVAIIILLAGVTYSQGLQRCSEYDIPNGITKFPDAKNNKNYFTCENGSLISKQCKNGYIFDSEKHDCIVSEFIFTLKATSSIPIESHASTAEGTEMTTVSPFACPGSEEKNYPHEKDCHKFYHCENHVSLLVTCPKFFLFDTSTSKCVLFWLAMCYVKTTTLPPVTTTTPVPPTCPPDQTIDYPYPNSCQRYYHCENGIREVRKCGFLYLFDRTELKCRIFFIVNCSVDLKSNTYTGNEIKYNPIDSNRNKEINSFLLRNEKRYVEDRSISDIGKEECGPNDNFKRPYPGVCNKFYECDFGKINVYRCFFIFNFDPVDLKCKWFWKVNCKAVPITTKEPTVSASTAVVTTTTTTAGYSLTGESTTSQSTILSSTLASTATGITTPSTASSTEISSTETTEAIREYDKEIDNLVKQPRSNFYEERLTIEVDENIDTYVCPPQGMRDDVFPSNCHLYYHCVEGILSVKKCSYLHNFDPLLLKCRWSFLVDCTARQTTTSTVTPSTYVTVYIPSTTPSTTEVTTTRHSTKHTTKSSTKRTHKTKKKTFL